MKQNNNLIEKKRRIPKDNTAEYKQIIPEHLSSVSGFSTTSIVDSQFTSISQARYVKKAKVTSVENF